VKEKVVQDKSAYPFVMGEFDTMVEVVAGRSISRYGDGELRAALGRGCISQVHDENMARELRGILRDDVPGLLVGIPNAYSATPKSDSWSRFTTPGFTTLYGRSSYASSFVTRPDSAPWIDTPQYWNLVTHLWQGKDVTLVQGDLKSLREQDMSSASSVRTVWAPSRDAYAKIKEIEEQIGKPSGPVIMCLGCTATVLASRLHKKGVWGIDLGHIGMFMRAQGIYAIDPDTLCSPKYRDLIAAMHKQEKWGGKGSRYLGAVNDLIDMVQAAVQKPREKVTVLDYGCGRGSLAEALKPHRCQQYDPAIKGQHVLPKPTDIVVCTDVLEHIEPKLLDNVLDHIERLAREAALLVISCRPANAVLPDGNNAHLIIESPDWWLERILKSGKWNVLRATKDAKQLYLELRRVHPTL
jgi:hypothetical protein